MPFFYVIFGTTIQFVSQLLHTFLRCIGFNIFAILLACLLMVIEDLSEYFTTITCTPLGSRFVMVNGSSLIWW
jgi:hypothetical protein